MPPLLPKGRALTIGEIADLVGATLPPGAEPGRLIRNIASLDTAGAGDISFLADAKSVGRLAHSHAGACLLPPRLAGSVPPRTIALATSEPYWDFVTVARALFPAALQPSSLFEAGGRAPGAQVHPSARIEAGVAVDPLAAVGPRAEIGAGTVIAAGAVIGPDVCIGRQCAIGPGATILNALIGDRVIVQAGARIGQDGFGYLAGAQGYRKIPHVRRVIVQDEVEIGANAAIDRGELRDTTIGEGTKIDNLAQIAHNVAVGRRCLIGAQSGIAAGATLGDFVTMGAQSGVADHVTIGDNAKVEAGHHLRADTTAVRHRARAAPPEG